MEENLAENALQALTINNTFGIPQEHDLLLAYDVYKPSPETKALKSEQMRSIFAETFIEKTILGTLSDLAVRALARAFPNEVSPLVSNEPLKLRIHYDSLDVDLPLEQCYQLTDEKYWRRVVLAKSPNKGLVFKRSHDWRNHAISLKYVEMVEACAAEYWPKEEMENLALKVKDYVTQMHISRLQSLQERYFEQFYQSESDDFDDEEDESDDEESTSSKLSNSADFVPEADAEADEAAGEEAGEEPAPPPPPPVEKTEEELQAEREKAERKAELKAELQAAKDARREERRKKREWKEARRKRREAKRPPPPPEPDTTAAGKKKKKTGNRGVFDLEISEDEDDGEKDKVDRRNIEKLLKRKKDYKYPPEDCHHIDLSFVRIFENLTVFSIEFQGPSVSRDYHTKHFNFSYDDMENLTNGISALQNLRVFRLRNSRMDARKLEIIMRALKFLETLESVDFAYDQLEDDCGPALYKLFQFTNSLKSLELEGNLLGYNVMLKLAAGLLRFTGTLNYLGLARNPLTDEALHVLVQAIIGSEHVRHFNLTGVQLSQEGVICCIAEELLRQHEVLLQLDLIAMPIEWEASVELIKALETNHTILNMDCRGCNLDVDIEYEIEVLLKRNRYIVQNPYIGDETKKEEEVMAWVNRMKNPILLHALAAVQKRADCRQLQPDEFNRELELQRPSFTKRDSVGTIGDSRASQELKEIGLSARETQFSVGSADIKPFVYEPNDFDEEQFRRHVFQPGPDERFFYFQEKKRRDLFKGQSQD